jgi:adenosylcobinamide-GDP ribazoletransferase
MGVERASRPSRWQELLAPAVLAVQFLTAVPLPLSVPAGPRQLGQALALFPLVGAALGLVLGGLDHVLRLAFPVPVATALLMVAATLLTGALHLDGLMDSVDGLFGGRTPQRRLEIMRDSRVGSYGALAGVLALLLKLSTLGALLPEARAGALVAALVAGRWAQVLAVWRFPAARPEGLGAAFKEGLRPPAVALATALAALATWLALGPTGPLLLLLTAPILLLVGTWMAAHLGGGLTGDTYGALNEVAEATVLLVLVSPLSPLLALRGGSGG